MDTDKIALNAAISFFTTLYAAFSVGLPEGQTWALVIVVAIITAILSTLKELQAEVEKRVKKASPPGTLTKIIAKSVIL